MTLTGDVERGVNGSDTVTVRVPAIHKWAMGILGTLLTSLVIWVSVLTIDYHGFRKDWERDGGYRTSVDTNTAFRLSVQQDIADNTAFRKVGDRVVPEDLDGLRDTVEKNAGQYAEIVGRFVDATADTNKLLVTLNGSVAAIAESLDTVKNEQNRIRDKLDRLERTP